MFLFARKMYQLTNVGSFSMMDNNNDNDDDKYEFDERERELLYATTKYVVLLSIALVSTWITFLLSWLEQIFDKNNNRDGVLSMVYNCIDCVINILCLYLQYEFNTKYYDKYCICFGDCCAYLFTKYARRQRVNMLFHHVASYSNNVKLKDDRPVENDENEELIESDV